MCDCDKWALVLCEVVSLWHLPAVGITSWHCHTYCFQDGLEIPLPAEQPPLVEDDLDLSEDYVEELDDMIEIDNLADGHHEEVPGAQGGRPNFAHPNLAASKIAGRIKRDAIAAELFPELH